jgi:DNA-binding winged helix-turn-helix (wHTH) protein
MLGGARNEPQGLGGAQDQTGAIVLAHERPFSIGQAEFRPATREVLFAGESSVIEPRVMQLLVALHRANGGVVSKNDLAMLCWEGRIVGEDSINRVVSRLRAVAEKQARGAFRIETITKVGYRLVA